MPKIVVVRIMEKVDRRVQKTNQSLQLAFKKLAKTTRYRDITVKQLTKTAQINRKTFYLHYDSIDDFSAMIADEISEKILQLILEKPLREGLSVPGFIFDKVFDFFSQSREFYTFMITSADYSFIGQQVETMVSRGLADAILKEFDLCKLDAYVCASFLIRNTLMLFRIYNDGQVHLDRSEFRDRLIRLNSSGLKSFLDINRNLEN